MSALLEVEGLHAHYDKSHILRGVHLTIGKGEIVSLLGRNGSGRSTKAMVGNVDLAPTVARILNLSMPDVQGRVLEEALKGGPPAGDYVVLSKTHQSSKKTGLKIKLPTDLDGQAVDPKLSAYSVELRTKILTKGGKSFTYFDQARAVRE